MLSRHVSRLEVLIGTGNADSEPFIQLNVGKSRCRDCYARKVSA